MDRRSFIKYGAAFGAAALAQPLHAQSVTHPLSRLIDINTGGNFAPDPQRFSIVLFMTAQQLYPDCGGAFIGTKGVVDFVSVSSQLQPVLVLPKFKNQPDPAQQQNLASATRNYADLNFRILTAELPEIRAVSRMYGDVFEFDDARGIVNAHTLDAFLLKPQSGEVLLRYRADDYYTASDLIQQLVDGCAKPENQALCL